MTHKRVKSDFVIGDKCRIISAPPLIDCNGIKNGTKCEVRGSRAHTVYVRVHKKKGLYPVSPSMLKKTKRNHCE